MKLAENIVAYRNKIGFTQERLAELCHVSRQAVAKWESGASEPSIEKLIILSRNLGVSIDELVKNDYALNKTSYNIKEDGYRMKEEYVHVFKRNMDTINTTLKHILNANFLPKEVLEGHFKTIKIALEHCEELVLSEEYAE